MELIEILTPDFKFADDRGCLTQLVHKGFDQINVLTTNQGVTRGGHYHKRSTEAFYVISGSVDVIITSNSEEKKYAFREGDFFLVRPFVFHSMFFPEICTMVQMYDECVELEDGLKDIFTE